VLLIGQHKRRFLQFARKCPKNARKRIFCSNGVIIPPTLKKRRDGALFERGKKDGKTPVSISLFARIYQPIKTNVPFSVVY